MKKFPVRMFAFVVVSTLAMAGYCRLIGDIREERTCLLYGAFGIVVVLGKWFLDRFFAVASDDECGVDKGGQGR